MPRPACVPLDLYNQQQDKRWIDRAHRELLEVLRLAPESAYNPLLPCGRSMPTPARRTSRARSSNSVVARDPENDDAHRLLGRLIVEAGKPNEGLRAPGDGSPASSGILGQPPGARTGIFRHRAPSGSDRRVPAPHRAAARFGVGLPDARHGLPCVGRSRARARELPEGDRDRTERPVAFEHRHAAGPGRPVRRGRRRLRQSARRTRR